MHQDTESEKCKSQGTATSGAFPAGRGGRGFGVGVPPPEEPLWGERRRWRVRGGSLVVPGCCEHGRVGVAAVTSLPSAGGASGLWCREEPPVQDPADIPELHTARGPWGLPWAAGLLPGLLQGQGQWEWESSGVRPPRAWACPSSCRARAALLPCPALVSGVAVGHQGCSHLSPCPLSVAQLQETFC